MTINNIALTTNMNKLRNILQVKITMIRLKELVHHSKLIIIIVIIIIISIKHI